MLLTYLFCLVLHFVLESQFQALPGLSYLGFALDSHRSIFKACSPQPSVSTKTRACSLAPQVTFKETDLLHQTSSQWAW